MDENSIQSLLTVNTHIIVNIKFHGFEFFNILRLLV